MKITFNNTLIAESDKTIVIEGNHYFPPDSVKQEYLTQSEKTYECPWKGHADYFNVSVDGQDASDAAWQYPQPKEAAQEIVGYYAFDKSLVSIEE